MTNKEIIDFYNYMKKLYRENPEVFKEKKKAIIQILEKE